MLCFVSILFFCPFSIPPGGPLYGSSLDQEANRIPLLGHLTYGTFFKPLLHPTSTPYKTGETLTPMSVVAKPVLVWGFASPQFPVLQEVDGGYLHIES